MPDQDFPELRPVLGPTILGVPANAFDVPRALTPAQMREAAEVGTMATQSASSVAITGGSVAGITDLAVADGGTGASSAADGRANLALPSYAESTRPFAVSPTGTRAAIAAPSASIYRIWQQIQAEWYWRIDLENVSGLPGSATVWQITNSSADLPWLSVDHTDGSVTRSGAGWSGPTSNAAAYGGSFHQNNTGTGQYVEWTTPANVVRVGVRTVAAVNCGIHLVQINGDTSLANLCPTAQTLVDRGLLASSALVANGGTLNPTDRVLDTNSQGSAPTSAVDYDRHFALADGLDPDVHTVRLTITGYQNTAAIGFRLYDSGWTYGLAATTVDTASTELLPHTRFTWERSAWEYAHMHDGNGGTDTFIGSVHGYEVCSTPAVYLDGLRVTPGSTPSFGSSVEVTIDSNLRHPSVGAGATNVASVKRLYNVDRNGLTISHATTWLSSATIKRSYPVMMPLHDSVFDRGHIDGQSAGYTLATNTDTFHGQVKAAGATLWQAGGKWIARCHAIDPGVTLSGYNNCLPLATAIQDRLPESAIYGKLSKVYLSRVSTSQPLSVSNGTVHRSMGRYVIARSADADTAVLTGTS